MRRVAGLLLALFLLQCALGLSMESGTCDELGAHIPAGILHWKSGKTSGGVANPPLGQLLVGAGPVLTGTANRPLRDDPRWLLPARLPVVLLGAATALLAAAMARRAGGRTAGLAALGAAALCPTLLAHSGLATLDVPVTAFFAASCVAAWTWHRARHPAALVAWGVACGTACLVKHTGLHLLPAIGLGALLAGGSLSARLKSATALAAAGLAGLAAMSWLAYGPGPSAALLPEAYVEALRDKWQHGRSGHFSYLLGERSLTGFPHYFLVALLVKTPHALQIAAIAGAILLFQRGDPGRRSAFVAFALVPALWILLAMSFVHRVHVGVRHVLPAYPALLALAGIGWSGLALRGGAHRWAAVALAAWAAGAAARATPDHLTYFNELAGGASRGDRILIDSNLDWGQAEGRMRAWAHGRDVHVNPDRPVEGLVAANVNAVRGILAADDRRLGWVGAFVPEQTFGGSWRVVRAREGPLREAARKSPPRALDLARWLIAAGRPQQASEVLARNDLSGHERLGEQWWALVAEARLGAGDPRGALSPARLAGDGDLLAEVAHRISESEGVSWPERGSAERQAVFAALLRRGHREEARELGARIAREHPDLAPAELGWLEARGTLPPDAARMRARVLHLVGDEEAALREAAELLVRDPGNADALALYGELVVRRKLGLTEYPLPDPDWSRISRAAGEGSS